MPTEPTETPEGSITVDGNEPASTSTPEAPAPPAPAAPVPAPSEVPAPKPVRWEGRKYQRDVLLIPCDPDSIPAECRIPEGVTPCDRCWIARDPRNVNDMWLITELDYAKYIR